MSPNIFIPQNAVERGLQMLPKDCNCIVCKLQKAEAKAKLGEDRFSFISTQLGIKTEK